MLESLAFRRAVEARKQTHPRVNTFYRGRLSPAEGARLKPLYDRFGALMLDTMERALDDMMALGESLGLPQTTDVNLFLEALHDKTGALPHDEDFSAFEDVLERFYRQPVYPLLEHAMFVHPVGIERLRQVLDLVPPQPSGGHRMADVAVGPAVIFAELLRQHPALEGAAFDISRPCVRYAERLLERNGLAERASVAEADARSLPVPDAAFSLVVATEVIEHVPDPSTLVNELHRVLTPEGVLIASVPVELPWGAHLAHFRSEAEIHDLFSKRFSTERFEVVPFGVGAKLCFGRFRPRS